MNDRVSNTRRVLEDARQRHMLALQAAIAAGTPADELKHDVEAFASAARQLLTLCSTASGEAPMDLVVAA